MGASHRNSAYTCARYRKDRNRCGRGSRRAPVWACSDNFASGEICLPQVEWLDVNGYHTNRCHIMWTVPSRLHIDGSRRPYITNRLRGYCTHQVEVSLRGVCPL